MIKISYTFLKEVIEFEIDELTNNTIECLKNHDYEKIFKNNSKDILDNLPKFIKVNNIFIITINKGYQRYIAIDDDYVDYPNNDELWLWQYFSDPFVVERSLFDKFIPIVYKVYEYNKKRFNVNKPNFQHAISQHKQNVLDKIDF